jgi:hypothetical protein
MTTAFVLGNGVSRQGISLPWLSTLGKIYGCNALYREFVPEVLVATDRPIATAIQESGYSRTNRFYTRRPVPDLGGHAVPSQYFGFSSGPIALSIAAQDHHSPVYLLGFDLGPTSENRFNNLYAGTDFYKPQGAMPTFTGNWVKQMVRVIQDYKHTQFVRLYGETTARIPELEPLRNLAHESLTTFMDRINTEKDTLQ